MFKKNNRYVAIRVNSKIDIRLQLAMWSLIDILKIKENVKVKDSYSYIKEEV